jgi:Domain of unknown function (DUF5710)
MISVREITSSNFGEHMAHLFGTSWKPKQSEAMPSIELNVPFAQKDEAKSLGAKWNPGLKKWLVPAGLSHEPFRKWMPTTAAPVATKTEKIYHQTLIAPLWLLESHEDCYKCHRVSKVFSIASQAIIDYDFDDDGTVYYSRHDRAEENDHLSICNLEMVDERIAKVLAKDAPNYRFDFSKTQGARVYMNHCEHCGAKLGDFFMHSEPGGAFFPDTYEEIEAMKRTLFESGEFAVRGSMGAITW